MIVNLKNVKMVELEVDAELAEKVVGTLSAKDTAVLFNEEKFLETGVDITNWNERMVEQLNEQGRKHIKKLYDFVCEWYEENPEDAEAEGYTEW